ncbi:ParA family protein [Ornithobacterium rhinotracheale]|uniref:ParA family protein n=1 Tax=Ornithobacterium rhinotracheale TaxID=28251 RepID=UPI00129CE63F|nr:ParA family protein [Ornithobacterium rhinotracheale]MRJ09277.1 ParA family protein [Ornithobacterium rhinotracheale]UOH77800.1 ParA family protein [Ornithobacterium rhinotracheale]
MIITFATQKGGVGKTTLAVAFANYLSLFKEKKVNVFDFDFQKSFYQKWEEDETLDKDKLYEVQKLEDSMIEDEDKSLISLPRISDMKESKEIYLFDLAGTLDDRYADVLIYSDYIVIPFEYSDVSVKSTLVFINLLGMIESGSDKIFVRSKYDKGYNYKNQDGMDTELKKYGKLIDTPVYKRNVLQAIGTRELNYEQKRAVEPTFLEIINYINETAQITI